MIIADALVRILFCSLMLYGIYGETGPWTAAFALVMIIRIEVEAFMDRHDL